MGKLFFLTSLFIELIDRRCECNRLFSTLTHPDAGLSDCLVQGIPIELSNMVPFRYVEFYDVPRAIVLRYKGKLLLLDSPFDDKLDDYSDSYSVYELPESVEPSLAEGSWLFLESARLACVGQIPVKAVRFDSTRRKALDPSVLDNIVFEA